VHDLGPTTVADLDDGARAADLDGAVAAAGWRELRTTGDGEGPLGSGVEVGVIAEELGRGLADAAFLGPTLAAELRRAAGAPAATTTEAVVLTTDLAAIATTVDGALPAGAVAVDVA